MAAQWLRLSRVQCWLSVVWCYPGKPNSISRLTTFYWHLLYVAISGISIGLPKILFKVPNVIMYGYINKQFLKYIFLIKCDHISNTNNSIHYNFSKGSRLRVLGVRDSFRCNFTLSQAIFFAHKGPQINSFEMSQIRNLSFLLWSYAYLHLNSSY